jgi:hypothetical protein
MASAPKGYKNTMTEDLRKIIVPSIEGLETPF